MASQVLDRDILPEIIKPINYGVSIYDIEMGGAFSYQGTVSILSKILRSSEEIILNSNQLRIHSAEISLSRETDSHMIKASSISYDAPRQRATISFSESLPVAEEALLVLKFQGTINHAMAGFYRSQYNPALAPAPSVPKDDDRHVMFTTQFEACDARRTFPCLDEPNLKATFDVELELPDDLVALSNMPEKSTKPAAKSGLKVVSFERTPVMSTYLLVWAIGDFEYIEAFTERKYNGKPLPCRVYTTRGLKHQAQYALEHTHKVVDFYSEVFGIDYPLPKLDLLAVHEFSHNAMENWGLVTYRTTAVLFDEESSDAKYKNKIAYVVAHELAHQWFGDLVTMDWWSELWLNEGFATWIGWLAVDKLHPDWNVWPQFVMDGMQLAFNLDSLRASHPIEVPVKDALDVDQIFDAVSYQKGSSVIRMLATHLGQETFLKGVSAYLKSHSYANARTTDLWTALSKASGQDINALMEPWIRTIGFPVITVTEEPGQISVRQSRYLSTGDVNSDDDKTTWWVPLGLRGKSGSSGVASIAFTKKEDVVRDVNDKFYKLNTDNAGFYRTNYPPTRLATLGTQIGRLSISDKIGLIGDAGALGYSGEAATPGLLVLTEGFSDETDFLVWSQILGSLNTVKSVYSEDPAITEGLKKFVLKLTNKAVDKIGWTESSGEDFLTSQLRSLLILSTGMNGHTGVIAESQKRFELYFSGKDKSAISPNLRTAVYEIAMTYGGQSEYLALKKEWETTTSIDGKEITISAMGRLQTPELLADYLEFVNNKAPPQDSHMAGLVLADNPRTRLPYWRYIQDNFDKLYARLGTNVAVFERYIRQSLEKFSDKEVEQQITAFFKDKNTRGYDRGLAQVKDTILGRAAYKERDAKVILEWLQVNGYA